MKSTQIKSFMRITFSITRISSAFSAKRISSSAYRNSNSGTVEIKRSMKGKKSEPCHILCTTTFISSPTLKNFKILFSLCSFCHPLSKSFDRCFSFSTSLSLSLSLIKLRLIPACHTQVCFSILTSHPF